MSTETIESGFPHLNLEFSSGAESTHDLKDYPRSGHLSSLDYDLGIEPVSDPQDTHFSTSSDIKIHKDNTDIYSPPKSEITDPTIN